MDKEKAPSYIKNRIDVKAQTIQVFVETIKKVTEEEKPLLGRNTQVLILTTLGQVHGKILTFTDNSDTTNDVSQILNERFLQLKNFGLAILEEKHNGEEISIVNNSGLVVVIDATLKPYANPQSTYNYKVLNLFADQIVGFSFGEIQED
jgi:hypothetical protein